MGYEDSDFPAPEDMVTDLTMLPHIVQDAPLEGADLSKLRKLRRSLDRHGLNVQSHRDLRAALTRAAFVHRMQNDVRELLVQRVGADERLYWIHLPIELRVIDADGDPFLFELGESEFQSRDYEAGTPLDRHCDALGKIQNNIRGIALANAGFDVIASAESYGLPLDLFRQRMRDILGTRAQEFEFYKGSESRFTPAEDPSKASVVLRLGSDGKVESTEIEFIYS